MDVIANPKVLAESLTQAKTLLSKIGDFPKCVFAARPISCAFFDFAYAASPELYETMLRVCSANGEDRFTFIMTQPEAAKYYQRFGWIPAASFSVRDSAKSFEAFVLKEPSNSSSDAIAYVRREVVAISSSSRSIAYGNDDFELGVIASFANEIDFEQQTTIPGIMSPDEAYDHLLRFTIYTRFKEANISREEFISSWIGST